MRPSCVSSTGEPSPPPVGFQHVSSEMVTLIDFVLSLSWQDREMGMDVACGNRVRTSDERFRRLQHQAEPKDLIPTGRTPQHTRKLTRCLCWTQLLLME